MRLKISTKKTWFSTKLISSKGGGCKKCFPEVLKHTLWMAFFDDIPRQNIHLEIDRERERDDLLWDRWNSGDRLYLFMENWNPFTPLKFNRQKPLKNYGWTTLLSFYSRATVRGERLNLQGVTSWVLVLLSGWSTETWPTGRPSES